MQQAAAKGWMNIEIELGCASGKNYRILAYRCSLEVLVSQSLIGHHPRTVLASDVSPCTLPDKSDSFRAGGASLNNQPRQRAIGLLAALSY
jgi:hypothetical protein